MESGGVLRSSVLTIEQDDKIDRNKAERGDLLFEARFASKEEVWETYQNYKRKMKN